jgi:hypothetical protein
MDGSQKTHITHFILASASAFSFAFSSSSAIRRFSSASFIARSAAAAAATRACVCCMRDHKHDHTRTRDHARHLFGRLGSRLSRGLVAPHLIELRLQLATTARFALLRAITHARSM